MIAGVFSILVAAVYIWRSRDYKRLLAYSSVEHLGIITLASGVGDAAMLGAMLHTLFNSFGKIALFFMAGRINRDLQTREIDSVHGLLQRLPWSGFVFGLAFFIVNGNTTLRSFFQRLFNLARNGSRAEMAASRLLPALADGHLHRHGPRGPAHVAKSGTRRASNR
jgi:formate hydrogenlyase subunit 3/multisubunit Na+/H+ antiporter MnhD subunit